MCVCVVLSGSTAISQPLFSVLQHCALSFYFVLFVTCVCLPVTQSVLSCTVAAAVSALTSATITAFSRDYPGVEEHVLNTAPVECTTAVCLGLFTR